MKQAYRKHNSPRLAVAIREACIIMYQRGSWWGCRTFHVDLAVLIYQIGLRADKYDVLCRVLAGHRQARPVFIRGDIRHKSGTFPIGLLILLALILLVFTN